MMQLMQRPLAWFLSAMLVLMPMMPAQAAMIGTDQIINQTDSNQTQEKLQQFLDREATQKQLMRAEKASSAYCSLSLSCLSSPM
jgi:hypothetical protein